MTKNVKNYEKALLHKDGERMAVITPKTIYIAGIDGLIIKHFPNDSRFSSKYYVEECQYPADLEYEKNIYFHYWPLDSDKKIELPISTDLELCRLIGLYAKEAYNAYEFYHRVVWRNSARIVITSKEVYIKFNGMPEYNVNLDAERYHDDHSKRIRWENHR